MADNRKHRVGYRTNGTAAYDINAARRLRAGNAAPEIQRPSLPEERPQPARRVKVKAKPVVSPFAIFGMAMAACMLVLVVFGYVQLYEATTETGNLNDRLADLNQENTMLRSEYEGKIDLAAVETRAIRELGMVQPTASQTVYLNLSGADRAVVLEQTRTNPVTAVVEAIKNSVQSLLSYLS